MVKGEQKKHLSKEYSEKVKAKRCSGRIRILCVKIVMRPKSQSLALKIKHVVIQKNKINKQIHSFQNIDRHDD